MPRRAAEPRGPAPAADDPCPDADDLVAFVGGGLANAALTRIEAHLDRCSTCARVAAEAARLADADPPTSVETAVVGTRATVDARVEPGTAIGRYIVLGRIGAGGMGEVYVAYDRELDRKVALKVLKPALDVSEGQREELQSRLQREARAMAKLNHPNVVPVHDVGWSDSQIFIAMEYIEGGTLQSWVAERTRSWREIRDIFVTTARALAAAHAVGLVHRDFKPSNVLIDRNGRPFVADFGLATSADDDPNVEIAGTPAYMAPEQRFGGIIDARTDQYGLCMALFEALHGRRPANAGTDVARAARWPSANAPAWLDAAARRGLAPDPADRFVDMDALVEALEQDRRIRRRRWIAVALLAALLAIALSAALVVSGRPSADDIAHVEGLETAARVEADAGRFIYPPAEDPDQPTAYLHVMGLEALAGPGGKLGRERAAALRAEFATHLVARADELWSTPGGDVFAIDLYVAALVFDPDNRSARARAALTPGEVVGLRQQAGALDFTASELAAARDFVELARVETAGIDSSDHAPRPAAIAQRLARMRSREPAAIAATAPSETPPSVVQSPAATPVAEPVPKASTPSAKDLDAELRAAFASLRSADLAVAAARFRSVLKDQPRSHRATAGLGEVEFERGAYAQAATNFEQAVALAPKRAEYRVLLGDALLKVQRWHDARRQYERGAALGSSVARKRMRQLDASVAAPPK